MRGAQSFLSGKLVPTGAPLSPGNTIPTGAFGNTVDCNPGIIENDRPCVSSFGWLYSYRIPKFSEKFFTMRHSSWKNPANALLRMFEGAAGYWKYWLDAPRRKSARGLPVAGPCPYA